MTRFAAIDFETANHTATVPARWARAQWDVYPTKLPDVCRHLGIDLRHHQADSDAEACARIVIAAQQGGWQYGRELQSP